VGRDSVYIATSAAGRSGDWLQMVARFSTSVQIGPGALPASYKMGNGSLCMG